MDRSTVQIRDYILQKCQIGQIGQIVSIPIAFNAIRDYPLLKCHICQICQIVVTQQHPYMINDKLLD